MLSLIHPVSPPPPFIGSEPGAAGDNVTASPASATAPDLPAFEGVFVDYAVWVSASVDIQRVFREGNFGKGTFSRSRPGPYYGRWAWKGGGPGCVCVFVCVCDCAEL